VLDGVVDHSIDLPTFITRNTLAVQDAFERFGRWCDRDSACALHGQDVGTVFDAVVTAVPATRSSSALGELAFDFVHERMRKPGPAQFCKIFEGDNLPGLVARHIRRAPIFEIERSRFIYAIEDRRKNRIWFQYRKACKKKLGCISNQHQVRSSSRRGTDRWRKLPSVRGKSLV
jgi:hypothetical protein